MDDKVSMADEYNTLRTEILQLFAERSRLTFVTGLASAVVVTGLFNRGLPPELVISIWQLILWAIISKVKANYIHIYKIGTYLRIVHEGCLDEPIMNTITGPAWHTVSRNIGGKKKHNEDKEKPKLWTWCSEASSALYNVFRNIGSKKKQNKEKENNNEEKVNNNGANDNNREGKIKFRHWTWGSDCKTDANFLMLLSITGLFILLYHIIQLFEFCKLCFMNETQIKIWVILFIISFISTLYNASRLYCMRNYKDSLEKELIEFLNPDSNNGANDDT